MERNKLFERNKFVEIKWPTDDCGLKVGEHGSGNVAALGVLIEEGGHGAVVVGRLSGRLQISIRLDPVLQAVLLPHL